MAVRIHRYMLCIKHPCASATWYSASVTPPISRLHLRVSGLSKWLFSMTIIVQLYWAVRPGTVLSTLHSHVSSSWQPSELGAVVISIFQLWVTEGRGGYVPCPRSSSSGSGIAGRSLRCGWLHRRGTTFHSCFHLNWPPCLCLDPTGKQKKQEQPVEEMLEELRAKLKWTQGELEAQREAERQRQLQVGLERKRPGTPARGLPRRPLRPPSPTGPEVWLVPCSWESAPGWHFLGVTSDLTLSGKENSIIFPNLYGQQESRAVYFPALFSTPWGHLTQHVSFLHYPAGLLCWEQRLDKLQSPVSRAYLVHNCRMKMCKLASPLPSCSHSSFVSSAPIYRVPTMMGIQRERKDRVPSLKGLSSSDKTSPTPCPNDGNCRTNVLWVSTVTCPDKGP